MRGDHGGDGSSATTAMIRIVTRTGAASALAVLLVSGPAGALRMSDARPAPLDREPAWAVRAERLASTYGCSTSGLEPGVVPTRAVVRDQGKVRLASFEEGWAMHRGEKPGTLVAVCRR